MAIGKEIKVVLSLDSGGFSVGIRDANGELKTIAKQVEQTSGSVKRMEDHLHSFGQKMHQTVLTLGMARFAFMDLNDIFLSFPKAILKSSGEVERLTKLMEGLSSETSDAKRKLDAASNVKFLFNLSQNAPFEIKAIGDAMVKFKTAGIDPANGSLKALIDSVARFGGNSDSLKRASIAIQQMAGKGVVSMEELRQQLGEAVPSAMAAMAEGMGLSMAELTRRVSRGTVEAKSAIGKMLAVMSVENASAAADMMGTWVGLIERLKTRWELFKVDIGGQGMFDGAKQALQELIDTFGSKDATAFGHSVGRGLNDAMTSAINLTKKMVELSDSIAFAGKAFVMYWAAGKGASLLQATWVNAERLQQKMALHSAWVQANMESDARNRAAQATAEAQALQRKIAILDAEIDAEMAFEQRKRDLAAQGLRDQVRANQAKIAAQEMYVVEMMQAEGALLADPAFATRNVAGLQTTAQRERLAMLEAEVVAKRTAANQARANIAALYEENRALTQQTALYARNSAAVTEDVLAKRALIVETEAQAAAATAAATAIMRENAAMSTAKSVGATVIDTIKGMVFSFNGLVIGIMAGLWIWDAFAEKAKNAAREAKTALEMRDRLRRGAVTDDDNKDLQNAIDRDENTARNKQAMLNVLYDRRRGEAARGINTKDVDERIKQANAELAEIRQKIETNRQNLADGIRQAAGKDADRQADEIAAEVERANAKLIKGFEGDKAALKKHFAEINKPTEAQDKEYRAAIKAVDLKIFEEQKANLQQQREHYEALSKAAESTERQRDVYAKTVERIDKQIDNVNTNVVNLKSDNVYVEPKKKKSPAKEPVDDLLAAIRADERKLQKAQQSLGRLAGEVGTAADLKRQSDAQIDLILKQDQRREFVHTEEDEKQARALRYQRLLLEEAEKMQSQVVPKLAASREKLDELRTQIDKRDYSDHPQDQEPKLLQDVKKMQAAMPGAAAAYQPLIAAIKEYQQVSRNVDANLGIISNERRLQGLRVAAIREAREKIGAEYQREKDEVDQKYSYLIAKTQQFSKEHKQLTDQHAEEVRLLNEKLAISLETPLDKMARDWQNTYDALGKAQANWGEGFVNMLTQNLGKGRMEVGKFVESVLRDILNMKLKQQLATPLNNIIDTAGGALMGSLLAPAVKPAVDQTAAETQRLLAQSALAASSGLTDVATKGAAEAVKGAVLSGAADAKAATTAELLSASFVRVTTVAELLAGALQQAAASAAAGQGGIGGSLAGLLGNAFNGGGGDLYSSNSLDTASLEAWAAGFANGGIMTSMGPVELRKYANGGIANAPQLALYGEGSMNEAYVPLPDGRSIPVTMTGAQQDAVAPSVTVNVINQSGQQVNAQQGGLRFDGKGYILDVVMTAANTPGPFRDNLKSAVKG